MRAVRSGRRHPGDCARDGTVDETEHVLITSAVPVTVTDTTV
jgi:hypothetical protein